MENVGNRPGVRFRAWEASEQEWLCGIRSTLYLWLLGERRGGLASFIQSVLSTFLVSA